MLVLGALGPGGDEVGELELAQRRPAAHDEALPVPLLLELLPAACEVLSDLVQVDVQGWGVAPR